MTYWRPGYTPTQSMPPDAALPTESGVPRIAQGWQCPVCKTVWAPGMPNCSNCRPPRPHPPADLKPMDFFELVKP